MAAILSSSYRAWRCVDAPPALPGVDDQHRVHARGKVPQRRATGSCRTPLHKSSRRLEGRGNGEGQGFRPRQLADTVSTGGVPGGTETAASTTHRSGHSSSTSASSPLAVLVGGDQDRWRFGGPCSAPRHHQSVNTAAGSRKRWQHVLDHGRNVHRVPPYLKEGTLVALSLDATPPDALGEDFFAGGAARS